MASEKILKEKSKKIDEIKDCVKDAASYILFDYRGLTDAESKELRRKLKENGSDYKVFKNTLMARAFNELNVDLTESLNGPSALAYSTDEISAIKILTEFAKTHQALIVKTGVVGGKVTGTKELNALASIPGREGLLTMLAGGLIAIPRDLSISLDLYAKQKEEN